MLDSSEELVRLKQRVAEIDKKFAAKYAAQQNPDRQGEAPSTGHNARWFIEEWSTGEVVRNEFGEHFQTERLFPAHTRHGSADIGALADLPADVLDAIGEGEIPAAPPDRWAFLDTETTGLIGGQGTYAFLIGVGRICAGRLPRAPVFCARIFRRRQRARTTRLFRRCQFHCGEADPWVT